MIGVNDIRAKFLDYFASEGHEIVPSSPLVPRNDPTLLFTNAGMVQFKNVFTGTEKRPYATAVTSQKCVRAGGKHNDLENVGYTARHHTFFEMLGNFSFGDYFKERAIDLAWRLITKEFDLPEERLLVTVYAQDDEAAALWQKVAGLPEEKIIRIATSDNFWQMGDTGPCGPCSEIFYDHGDHIPGGPPGSPDEDGDRFIEIWNLVFMQFDQDASGRTPLPKPSIDTGMGLERIATILQGVHDNYDIDLFKALIAAAEDAIGTKNEGQASFKVIADHLRATGFLMADGVLPSNEGRGYVLRRIMRRAMRHANMLGAGGPVLHRLVPSLVREMGQAYPELVQAESLITETTRSEEERFGRTLTHGLSVLEEATADLSQGDALAGQIAFKLYDTYGFPYDLTEDALRPRGLTVDRDGFDAAMEAQRAKARAAWSGSGEAADDKVWFAIRERAGATEFLGYDTDVADGSVVAIVAEGTEVAEASSGSGATIRLVTNQTPFYAESGGQVGDTGTASAPGVRLNITATQKVANGLFVHQASVEEGTVRVGDSLTLQVNEARRSLTRANHSATHIIHECLRRALGDHVAQKGSLVAPERLRFDFSHTQPMSAEDVAAVEEAANVRVRQNDTVDTRVMPIDEARESGARALFGEKYGDEVRVVSMGRDGDTRFSVELCGGTHVARTGDIGLVAITDESAVSAGVRRVEALTGEAARQYLAGQRQALRAVASALRVAPDDAAARVEALVDERRQLERELEETRKKLALAGPAQDSATRTVAGANFVGRVVDGLPGKALKGLADEARDQAGSAVVAIVGRDEGRASVVVTVSPDLTERFDAVALVREGAKALGGKGGGGRRDMAQAGGPDADKADDAIAAIASALESA